MRLLDDDTLCLEGLVAKWTEVASSGRKSRAILLRPANGVLSLPVRFLTRAAEPFN